MPRVSRVRCFRLRSVCVGCLFCFDLGASFVFSFAVVAFSSFCIGIAFFVGFLPCVVVCSCVRCVWFFLSSMCLCLLVCFWFVRFVFAVGFFLCAWVGCVCVAVLLFELLLVVALCVLCLCVLVLK